MSRGRPTTARVARCESGFERKKNGGCCAISDGRVNTLPSKNLQKVIDGGRGRGDDEPAISATSSASAA